MKTLTGLLSLSLPLALAVAAPGLAQDAPETASEQAAPAAPDTAVATNAVSPAPAGQDDTLGATTNTSPDAALMALRDPFWPVGYVKPQPKSVKKEPKQVAEEKKDVVEIKKEVIWPKLNVKGLTRTPDGNYMAIVDRVGIVQAGDTIKIEHDSLIYRWKIQSITPQGLGIQKLDVAPVDKPGQRMNYEEKQNQSATDGLQ